MEIYEFLSLLILSIGVCVAVGGILTQRKISRQRNTLDFHEKYLTKEYDACFKEVHKAYTNRADIPLKEYASRKESPEYEALRCVLNTWEHFAMGVKFGVYDEEMIKNSFKTHVLSIARGAQQFVLGFVRKVCPQATVYARQAYHGPEAAGQFVVSHADPA